MEEVLFYTLVIFGFINIVHIAIYLIGANVYDVSHYIRDFHRPKTRSHRCRPLVSVLIPAHNEELGIVKTLESVRKSSYRKLQIIVIDDASTDKTKQLVRQYIKEHPSRDINLMWLRTNRGKADALNHGLRRKAKGEFVMTIDADSVIHKNAIKNAVSYFKNPKIMAVAANVRVDYKKSLLGLLQMFEHMIGYQSKKFYTVANCEYIIGGVASTYRMSLLRKLHYFDTDTQTEDIGLSLKIASSGNRENRLIYASDVVAMTSGVLNAKSLFRQRYRWKLGMLQNLFKNKKLLVNRDKKYSFMLTHYRIPMAFLGEIMLILEPVMIGYVLYLSIQYNELGFFAGAYFTIVLYLLFTVWQDEHLGFVRRATFSVYLPVMYFVFYLMNIIQLFAIMKCIVRPDKVLLKSHVSSTWISPERAKS